MAVLYALGNFFGWFFKRAVGLFTSLPGQIAVVVSGVAAVCVELSSFIGSAADFMSGYVQELGYSISSIASVVHNSPAYMTFAYMVGMDAIINVLGGFATFFISCLTFLFAVFMHLVFVFLGLRYGYKCYKYLLTILSNGMAKV